MADGNESGDPRYAEGYVTPNPSTPKTIGTLNIVFGSALLLCGGCYGMYMMMLSAMSPMIGAQTQAMQVQIEAGHRNQIDDLRKKEDEAETEEERTQLHNERLQLEAQPVPKMPDMMKMYGMSDPVMVSFVMTDALSGLILNLSLLITGIGLVGLKEWARVAANWVAGLKIVRLVALYGFSIAVVIPIQTKMMSETMEEMMRTMPKGQGAPPPAGGFATVWGTMMTGSAVFMILCGIIYPAVSIWFLTRPSAKAACNMPRPE